MALGSNTDSDFYRYRNAKDAMTAPVHAKSDAHWDCPKIATNREVREDRLSLKTAVYSGRVLNFV